MQPLSDDELHLALTSASSVFQRVFRPGQGLLDVQTMQIDLIFCTILDISLGNSEHGDNADKEGAPTRLFSASTKEMKG